MSSSHCWIKTVATFRTSVGWLSWDIIGLIKNIPRHPWRLKWSMQSCIMLSSISVIVPDWSLHPWLIGAIVHWWELSTYFMEVPLKALQEQEKRKLSRICQKHSQYNVLSSIAPTVSITSPWESFSKDSQVPVLGAALMSLTELILKCCQLLPSKYSQFNLQSDKRKKYLTLTAKILF